MSKHEFEFIVLDEIEVTFFSMERARTERLMTPNIMTIAAQKHRPMATISGSAEK